MRAASPKAADDDLGGQAILEEALNAIEGVATVLFVIGRLGNKADGCSRQLA
jgi:hypothetical protein